jgi:hypothetical protein
MLSLKEVWYSFPDYLELCTAFLKKLSHDLWHIGIGDLNPPYYGLRVSRGTQLMKVYHLQVELQ